MNYAPLSDRDLLARLIGVRDTAKFYHGSLKPLFSEQTGQAFDKCAAARELVKRWLDETMRERCVLSTPEAVRAYLRIHFAGREYESFVVLFLDTQNRLVSVNELFRGTLNQTSVYPREIVKAALKENAAAVIFSHTHPNGVVEPSRADETLTGALKQALALVDVKVLDHFIVAGPSTLSFAEQGLL